MLAPPCLYPMVHDPLPQGWEHRRHGHQRIAEGQLRGLILSIGLQDGKASVGLVVVVGMALEVDQEPVRRALVGVPAVARLDMFVFAVAKVTAGQAVMLDVGSVDV